MVLVQRFMLNLRQFNDAAGPSTTNSDVEHFSRFSVNFRVPSHLLGNIGEPLDHNQSDQWRDDRLREDSQDAPSDEQK